MSTFARAGAHDISAEGLPKQGLPHVCLLRMGAIAQIACGECYYVFITANGIIVNRRQARATVKPLWSDTNLKHWRRQLAISTRRLRKADLFLTVVVAQAEVVAIKR